MFFSVCSTPTSTMGDVSVKITEVPSLMPAQIQREMLDQVRKWIEGSGRDKQAILNRLTSDSVRQHKNKRLGDNSTDGGHVHNQMLPEGGLQQVLAQHNVHVVGR